VNAPAWMQLIACLATLLLSWPLARAVEAVMAGRFALDRRVEAPLFHLARIDAEQ
jgi:K+-transporting ATPase ATPase A chain